MLRNYITVALRSMRRQTGYTAINVFGLAVGLSCTLLIALYVLHEVSYDDFHNSADSIYRITYDRRLGDEETHTALTPPALADVIDESLPEATEVVRFWRDTPGAMTVRHGDQAFQEEGVVFADPNVFRTFSFPLVRGDARTALTKPYTIVLTERAARKYFGGEDPIGQTLVVRPPADRDLFEYTVTGVVTDLPTTSHIQFDFLASVSAQRMSRSDNLVDFGVYTYVDLRDGADPKNFEARLNDAAAARADRQMRAETGLSIDMTMAQGGRYQFRLQPLTDIHLHSRLQNEFTAPGDARSVIFFSAIAIIVLLLACVNFINLATARGAARAREVGIRKVLGAPRERLVAQFLTESILLTFAALGIGLLIVSAVMPTLTATMGMDLATPAAFPAIPLVIMFALLVGAAAGFYPAVVLSSFRPDEALRGGFSAAEGRPTLRNGLIIIQFAVSIVLLAATAVVYRQMQYVQKTHLGFDAQRVVVLEGAEVMGSQIEAFKREALVIPGIERITNSEQVPGRPFSTALFRAGDDPELVEMAYTYTGFDFVETYGLDLVAGRSLSRGRAEDSLGVILNETAVTRLRLVDPIGKQIVWPDEATYTVVGVVRDFHVTSLHHEIAPVALLGPDPRNQNRPNLLLSARIGSSGVPETLAALGDAWSTFAPAQPFVYRFVDADFEALYRRDRISGRLFGGFAAMAILLACIGLLGLTAYTSELRTKEIGIRKVLGASVSEIVVLLSKDYLRLVAIAFIVALPAAYVLADLWLRDFILRVDTGFMPFLAAGVLAALLAIAMIGFHAARSALRDPVESLRSE